MWNHGTGGIVLAALLAGAPLQAAFFATEEEIERVGDGATPEFARDLHRMEAIGRTEAPGDPPRRELPGSLLARAVKIDPGAVGQRPAADSPSATTAAQVKTPPIRTWLWSGVALVFMVMAAALYRHARAAQAIARTEPGRAAPAVRTAADVKRKPAPPRA